MLIVDLNSHTVSSVLTTRRVLKRMARAARNSHMPSVCVPGGTTCGGRVEASGRGKKVGLVESVSLITAF